MRNKHARRSDCRRDSGSALIESVLAAPVLIMLVSGLLLAAYSGFAKIWIRHLSYEAVICLASRVAESACRERVRDSIEGALPAKFVRPRFVRSSREAKVKFEVTLLPGLVVREERTLRLPLPARRGRS